MHTSVSVSTMKQAAKAVLHHTPRILKDESSVALKLGGRAPLYTQPWSNLDNLTSPGEGQYFVVSVRDSTSSAEAYPTATAGVPFSQSSFHVNSPPPLLNGVHSQTPLAPGATPTTYGSPSADFSARKRSNISTGSLEQADDQTTSGVYAMEKVGPVKDALYHKTCFTCAVCRTKLTLHNFHHSDADMADLHVYCHSHKPAARANPVDSSSVGIQRALTVPRLGRINDQIRGGPEASKHVHLDSNAVSIRSAMCAPAPTLQTSIKTREGAWFREQRKSETMPPEDVVKHDGKQKQYQGSRSLYIDT
nr:hypothetical protein BaRGS_002028 [Batillaria attramentaria]